MPYGKGPIKMGKGGKDKDKLKDKARKLISNPKKLGGKNLADLLGISDPSRKNVKGGKKLLKEYGKALENLKKPPFFKNPGDRKTIMPVPPKKRG